MNISVAPMTAKQAASFVRKVAETTALYSKDWENFEEMVAGMFDAALSIGPIKAAQAPPPDETRESPKKQLRDTSALVQAAREAFGRHTPGTCRWLSEGDGCTCLKCVADALVLVTAQRDSLQHVLDRLSEANSPEKEAK